MKIILSSDYQPEYLTSINRRADDSSTALARVQKREELGHLFEPRYCQSVADVKKIVLDKMVSEKASLLVKVNGGIQFIVPFSDLLEDFPSGVDFETFHQRFKYQFDDYIENAKLIHINTPERMTQETRNEIISLHPALFSRISNPIVVVNIEKDDEFQY